MLLYLDLFRRLQKMSNAELQRPVIVHTKGGTFIGKSLCEAQDYDEIEWRILPRDHVVIDAVHDECETTLPLGEDLKEKNHG